MFGKPSSRHTVHLLAAAVSLALLQTHAFAQTPGEEDSAEARAVSLDTVVVTGSRIARPEARSDAPISVVTEAEIREQGYVQVGEALNKLPSNVPMEPASPGNGATSGSGRQYPNLFGLGPGRTLTLLNGRRMVTTGNGMGDRVVDTNMIPVGLLERVDVVQAGGAAVYGSDAIAGVVNYVLKSDFEGTVIDAQYGESSRGDYPKRNVQVTWGRNFADNAGNIAVNVNWSKTNPLLFGGRPVTDPVMRVALSNPYDTGPDDGISAVIPVPDPHFWTENPAGVIFGIPAPVLTSALAQVTPDGSGIAPYNPGQQYAPPFACAIPFCSGGDGYPYAGLASLYTGVETLGTTALGHYWINDRAKLSGELMYARTTGTDPLGTQAPGPSVIGSFAGGSEPYAFNRDNPYLNAEQVAALSALSPAFAAGGDLYLSKSFEDLLHTRTYEFETQVKRGVIALDGYFDLGGREYDYGLYYTRSEVTGWQRSHGVLTANYRNALNTVRNPAGEIVCAINATSVVDPACAPLNPFGENSVSQAARDYATARTGHKFENEQDDFLANVGGDLWQLPAGAAKFNLAYEHRRESASYVPEIAQQQGLIGSGAVVRPTSGSYNTNELSGEVFVPILGGDKSFNLARTLELSGQFRHVDNSLAGSENVWGAGLQWETVGGLTLRGSRSRNFRAPSLDQLLAPTSVALQSGIIDPCDQRYLQTGPNVAARQAACTAVFAQNPQWGPLEDFVSPGVNFGIAMVESGGNPDLRNEISYTTTYGFVWQPSYVPGNLLLVADRIQVNLKDGLTAFTPSNFSQACFDATVDAADVCSSFSRDPATGYIVTARSTTVNAAMIEYVGETYLASYGFPGEWLASGLSGGNFDLQLNITRNRKLTQTVAGATTEVADTTALPSWVGRFNAQYSQGPLGLSYEAYYLPESQTNVYDTIETTPYWRISSNLRHSVAMSYTFGDATRYQIRAGVNNLTDRTTSFPTFTYGDLIGRQYFAAFRIEL